MSGKPTPAGYDFHNWYGFGAVDIDAAVAMASDYTADSLGAFVESDWFDGSVDAEMPLSIPDADGAGTSAVLDVAGLPDTANIEAVVLEIDAEHTQCPRPRGPPCARPAAPPAWSTRP